MSDHAVTSTDARRPREVTPEIRRQALRLERRSGDAALLVLRLSLAVVIFPHGAQKLLGWYGGAGFPATMEYLTGTTGLPAALAVVVILVEFFAPLVLAAGAFTRLAAAGIGSVMVGAVLTTHLPYGFFMNWYGAKAGEGFEYHLLALGIALALAVAGGGELTLDRLWRDAPERTRAEGEGASG